MLPLAIFLIGIAAVYAFLAFLPRQEEPKKTSSDMPRLTLLTSPARARCSVIPAHAGIQKTKNNPIKRLSYLCAWRLSLVTWLFAFALPARAR